MYVPQFKDVLHQVLKDKGVGARQEEERALLLLGWLRWLPLVLLITPFRQWRGQ